MRKRWLACIMCFVMLSSVFLFSACTLASGNGGEIDPNLQTIMDVQESGVDIKSFTYTYYDEDGRELLASAFKEAYIFVDPGAEGLYYDKKTDSTVEFSDLVEREADTIAENLAYRLIATYGDHTTDEVEIEQKIIEGIDTDASAEVLASEYKIKFDSSDAFGEDIKDNSVFKEDNLTFNDPYRYYINDTYMLSLLMGLDEINSGDFSESIRQDVLDDFQTLKNLFIFDDTMSGTGFGFNINSHLVFELPTNAASTSHQWEVYKNLSGNVTIDDLKAELKNIVLDAKSGNTTDATVVDHLGFTSKDKEVLKDLLIERIIGKLNYIYDNDCLTAIIHNSSNNLAQAGGYITLNKEANDPRPIYSTSQFMQEYEAIEDVYEAIKAEKATLDELQASLGVESDEYKEAVELYNSNFSNYQNAYNTFMANEETKSYLKTLEYKGYGLALDVLIDEVLNSPQYKGEDLIPNEGDGAESLYPLFPRIQILIVPSVYLGGKYDESLEEDLKKDENGNYNFEKVSAKDSYDPNNPPKTTMEPYLPFWKIISVVYKPGDYYGSNNVTYEKINGVIVPNIDIAFVGEVGYTSMIESTVSYVAGGNEIISAGEVFVSDELVDDVCPDMSATDYSDNHYLTLFDLVNTKTEDLGPYVMSAYNGIDLKKMAETNDKIEIGLITTTEGTIYYEQVNGLPIDENFLTLMDTESGSVISMPGLGDNYLKLDVNFNKIVDKNANDVTASKKRTELGIISIEPHTAS